MEVLLSFDEAHRILYIRFEGILTDKVLLGGYTRVRQWMNVHGPCSSISDFSDVSSFNVSSQGVRLLAAQPPLVPDGFLRLVVAPLDLMYGMTRMFESFGSETRDKVDIVRSLAEAYQLAGVESLDLQSIIS